MFNRSVSRSLFAAVTTTLLISLPTIASAQHKHSHHHHHHAEAKEVAALHATLAPLWHAPKGKERIEAACAKAALMEQQTQAITGENAAALQEVAALFKEKCAAKAEEAEAVFGKLHDAFHKVSEHKH
jgi:hypothetical protein